MRPLKVNRVEVIDHTGRAYVYRDDADAEVTFSLQDRDRTLKVFITRPALKPLIVSQEEILARGAGKRTKGSPKKGT